MNDGATMKTIVGWPVNEIWALTLNVDLEDHQDILSDNQRDDIGPRLVVLQDVKWWLISRVDGDFTRVSFGKSSEYPDPSSNQYVQTSNPRQRKNNPNNERNQRNEQRMSNGWSWFSPFWHVVLWGKKTNVFSECSDRSSSAPAASRWTLSDYTSPAAIWRNWDVSTAKMVDFQQKTGGFPSMNADYPLGFSAMEFNGIWKNPIKGPIIQSPRSYWVNLYT